MVLQAHSLVVPAVLCLAVVAQSESLTVPSDASLEGSEYAKLGVPDPSREWTASEYEQALNALSGISRLQLPRAGSKRSHALFNRLLISYSREFDLTYENAPGDGAPRSNPPPSLPVLYSTTHEDHLLFDNELVAIGSETLARSLKTLPARAELSALRDDYVKGMQSASSETEREHMSARIRRTEESSARVARQVRNQTSDLLAIAGIPELEDPARQKLLDNFQELLSQIPKFLTASDVRWVATLLRGAASPEFNTGIRSGLLKLAEQLDATASNS